jgi:hypothetical protein
MVTTEVVEKTKHFILRTFYIRSWYSVVGIATGYRLDN